MGAADFNRPQFTNTKGKKRKGREGRKKGKK